MWDEGTTGVRWPTEEGRGSLCYNRKNKSRQRTPPRDPSDTPTPQIRLDINLPPSAEPAPSHLWLAVVSSSNRR